MQVKVLDFVEKEGLATPRLGGSIQQSHNRLLKLEGTASGSATCSPTPRPAVSAGKAPPTPTAPGPSQCPLDCREKL